LKLWETRHRGDPVGLRLITVADLDDERVTVTHHRLAGLLLDLPKWKFTAHVADDLIRRPIVKVFVGRLVPIRVGGVRDVDDTATHRVTGRAADETTIDPEVVTKPPGLLDELIRLLKVNSRRESVGIAAVLVRMGRSLALLNALLNPAAASNATVLRLHELIEEVSSVWDVLNVG
jgi:hypothetical protein